MPPPPPPPPPPPQGASGQQLVGGLVCFPEPRGRPPRDPYPLVLLSPILFYSHTALPTTCRFWAPRSLYPCSRFPFFCPPSLFVLSPKRYLQCHIGRNLTFRSGHTQVQVHVRPLAHLRNWDPPFVRTRLLQNTLTLVGVTRKLDAWTTFSKNSERVPKYPTRFYHHEPTGFQFVAPAGVGLKVHATVATRYGGLRAPAVRNPLSPL